MKETSEAHPDSTLSARQLTKPAGKRPFWRNANAAKRNAKLHRMIKAGTLKPMTKEQMRIAAHHAIDRHAITAPYDPPDKLDMQPGKVQYATRGTPE